MKKSLILAVFCTTLFTLIAGNFKVTVITPTEMEGSTAYLTNYDTGERIDSAVVRNAMVVFDGTVEEPFVSRLIIDAKRVGQFVIEDADISFNVENGTTTGGVINAKDATIDKEIQQYVARFQNAENDSLREIIYGEYQAYTDRLLEENIDNPIGYMLFMEKAYEMLPEELEAFVGAHPYFGKFVRVQKLLEANRSKLASSEGAVFTDFEIEYDGVKHKLSDVVGKGDYVLVDFWASWCGPCIRQTAVLKDIYNEYKNDGLKVLGIAVWDEPVDTKKAIVKHELPWECWLNGQNIPTDAYGISGIPCIILFGPDGTIISRDKFDDELKEAVANAMSEAKANK